MDDVEVVVNVDVVADAEDMVIVRRSEFPLVVNSIRKLFTYT